VRKFSSTYIFCLVSLLAACSNVLNSGSKSEKKKRAAEVSPEPNKAVDPSSAEGESDPDLGALPGMDPKDWPKPLNNTIPDGTKFGTVLCKNGLKTVENAGKANFNTIFQVVCAKDGNPTKLFGDLFSRSFNGSGTGDVAVVAFKSSDIYVTKFIYAHGVKASLPSPAKFAGLPIYEEIGKGIKTKNSLFFVKKMSEKTFPGKGSLRQIILDYDMPYAEGAALYDRRTTESNLYLLDESSQGINITVEHLLNPESNPYYHSSNGLVVGIQGEEGETYLIYVTELVIKNRFDPGRLRRAVIDFTKIVQQTVHRVGASAE
jgi:hypothetical protein